MSSSAHFLRTRFSTSASAWQIAIVTASWAIVLSSALTIKSMEAGSALSEGHLAALSTAPIYFEAVNASGQDAAQFIGRGRGFSISIAPTEATLILGRRDEESPNSVLKEMPSSWTETRALRMKLANANPHARLAGLDQMRASVNYLVGSDHSEWRTRVPLFNRMRVSDAYPGVQLVYYANESAQLEYDFILQPRASLKQVVFQIEGADGIHVDADGNLIIRIGPDEVRQHAPVIYQSASGARKKLLGGYRLVNANTIGFWVSEYDRNLPLVVDPTLSFSTYLGGSKLDIGWSIALDPSGNIYIAGETLSKLLPTSPNALEPVFRGGTHGFGDAFVAKYDSSGSNLIYLTYLGGKRDDGALGVAVDSGGNACVTGFTDSDDFPIVPANAIRTKLTGKNNNALRLFPVDAFVAKLDPSGSSLAYSTLLGGDGRDEGVGIALDPSGNAYVTGLTESTNFFPISANAFQTNSYGDADVFVTKLIDGVTVGYSTYLGGSNQEYGLSIAADSSGSAFVTGFTRSTNFPTLNAISLGGITYTNLNTQTNFSSKKADSLPLDAFVTKLSPDGSALVFSTYLGGTNDDAGQHLTLDSSGNVYVTGYTFSTNFPVTVRPSPQSSATKFDSHPFVTKLGGAGNLIYSTQFGGSRADQGASIAVDSTGNAYVAGSTRSDDFFATNAFTDLRASDSPTHGKKGTNDVFVAVLDPSASTFVHSVIIGGFGNDQPNGIAVDPSGGSAVIVGQTSSADFPLVNPLQTQLGAAKKSKDFDAFVEKILFP